MEDMLRSGSYGKDGATRLDWRNRKSNVEQPCTQATAPKHQLRRSTTRISIFAIECQWHRMKCTFLSPASSTSSSSLLVRQATQSFNQFATNQLLQMHRPKTSFFKASTWSFFFRHFSQLVFLTIASLTLRLKTDDAGSLTSRG